jgi:hypothetical protein
MKSIYIEDQKRVKRWRIIVPPSQTKTGKRLVKFFETKEQADAAIEALPEFSALRKFEIEAKIEPIVEAIGKLNESERYNLIRRLNRSVRAKRSVPQSTTRYRSNSQYKIRTALGNRLNELVKTGKAHGGKILEIIGCTIPKFMAHLQGQFREGMAWNNYGPVWHIDHIRPCASFDLTDPEQLKVCFHWTNLQPLFAIENLKKGTNS